MFRKALIGVRIILIALGGAAVLSIAVGQREIAASLIVALLLAVALLQTEIFNHQRKVATSTLRALKRLQGGSQAIRKLEDSGAHRRGSAVGRGTMHADDMATLLHAIEEQHLGRLDRLQDRLEVLMSRTETDEKRVN